MFKDLRRACPLSGAPLAECAGLFGGYCCHSSSVLDCAFEIGPPPSRAGRAPFYIGPCEFHEAAEYWAGCPAQSPRLCMAPVHDPIDLDWGEHGKQRIADSTGLGPDLYRALTAHLLSGACLAFGHRMGVTPVTERGN
jgi:hypothetical protein